MLTKCLSVSSRVAGIALLSFWLVACGVGSTGGEDNTTVVDPNQGQNGQPATVSSYTNYEGTASPNDTDVQNFRLHFWSNLASAERCGACHVVGGAADDLRFFQGDNINADYNLIVNYTLGSNGQAAINKTAPPASGIVSYISNGHNCWKGSEASDNASCAADIQGYIALWAAASAPSSFLGALSTYAPENNAINTGKRFASTTPTEFGELHTTLQTYCASCHTPESDRQQQPFFAVSDADGAYQAIQNKVDINQTANSRLYRRLEDESHNCWTDCEANAAQILANIDTLVGAFSDSEGLPDGLDEVASGGLTLTQGFQLSVGSRVEDNAVGLWKFTEGSGVVATNIATDDANDAINIDLRLTGDIEWWGSGGITVNEGKLQADTAQSKTLFDTLKSTGEYSIEAWVIPLNVTQGENDPATIVSYSLTTDRRNFMLSQQLYNYNFYNRNTLESQTTDQNGEPILATPDADEVAQASLQHVVVTYSATEGRTVYVNGEVVAEEADASLVGTFNDWEDDFALVVANEVSSNRQWQGTIRLLAIHKTALAADEIKTNFDIGVGDKYYLMFPIEDETGLSDTYIVFQVEEFDQYSYLFSSPIFYTADETVDISGLTVKGLRIGINTREAESGQAYINIDTDIDSSEMSFISEEDNGGMQQLSRIGTIIPKEFGPTGSNADQFFVTFDEIAANTYARPVVTYTTPVIPDDDDTEQSLIGLKTFAEINASLSALTGISATNSNLLNSDGDPIYEVVKQQMPSTENIAGFVSAHQMGIAQLAFKYCDVLVEAGGSGAVDFGGFNFAAAPTVAFDTNAKKEQIIAPLLENLLADDSADHVDDQPVAGDFGDGGTRDMLADLMDAIVANGVAAEADSDPDTSASSTSNIVKATCAAAYGSALMLIQ